MACAAPVRYRSGFPQPPSYFSCTMEEDTSKKPRQGRPHSITLPPPALGWSREVAALEDTGGDLAITLWRILRRVRVWADAQPEARASLSPEDPTEAVQRLEQACRYAPELLEAFRTFAALIRTPRQVQARQLAEACRLVVDWAQELALPQVAMLFAEAAAIADPRHATWANDAAQMCRRIGLAERSLVWFHRGFGIAVRTKNQDEALNALHREGLVMSGLGRYDQAKSLLNSALRRAQSGKVWVRAGAILHDLMGVSLKMHMYLDLEEHVLQALDYYPACDPRIPMLAHDWAICLSDWNMHSVGASLLSRLLPVFPIEQQPLGYSNLAICLAGAGLGERVEEAAGKVLELIGVHRRFTVLSLNALAEASGLCGRWDRAEEFARRALEIARIDRDIQREQDALKLLDQIARRDMLPPLVEIPNHDRVEMTTRRVVARLERWKQKGIVRPNL